MFFYACCLIIQSTWAQKQNIVVLFSDDQRFHGTIHALGGKDVITPNLDVLVSQGTAFTNAYVMGGSQGAVCVPSRNMLMTGRNLFSMGGDGSVVQPQNAMLGETLGKNGYATHGIGKWHNDKKAFNRSFQGGDEIFFGGMSYNPYNVGMFRYDSTAQYISTLKDTKEKGDHINAKHHTEVFADAAVRFIEGFQAEKPFFLYVAFKSPHDPREMPEKFKALYDTSKINIPENFMPKHPFDNGELQVRDELLASFPRKTNEIKEHIRDYYAMMTHLDEQVGRIIEALKATGKYENTIIVFAGDNGLALGQHGLMGKQNVYEHSVKVPLIMVGKGIPKGQRDDRFTYLFDVFPTLCNLVGIPNPSSVQGQNVLSNSTPKEKRCFMPTEIFKGLCEKETGN
jgi:arylsulfatase A-like enzyme